MNAIPNKVDLPVTWIGKAAYDHPSLRQGSLCFQMCTDNSSPQFMTAYMINETFKNRYFKEAVAILSMEMNSAIKSKNERLFNWYYSVLQNEDDIDWNTFGVKRDEEERNCTGMTPSYVSRFGALTLPPGLSAGHAIKLSCLNTRIFCHFFQFMGIIKGMELDSKGMISTEFNSETQVYDYWKFQSSPSNPQETHKIPGQQLFMYLQRRTRDEVDGFSDTMEYTETLTIQLGPHNSAVFTLNPELELRFAIGIQTVPTYIKKGIHKMQLKQTTNPGGVPLTPFPDQSIFAVPNMAANDVGQYDVKSARSPMKERDGKIPVSIFVKETYDGVGVINHNPNNMKTLIGVFSKHISRFKPFNVMARDGRNAANAYSNAGPTLNILTSSKNNSYYSGYY